MPEVCLIVCLITFGYTLWLQFCFCLVSLRGGLRVAFWALIGSCIYVTFQIKPHSLGGGNAPLVACGGNWSGNALPSALAH